MGAQAGWLPDPTARHDYRWWDGTTWTEVVADQGVESVDPPPTPQPYQPQHQQPPQESRHGSLVFGALAIALVVVALAIVVLIVDRTSRDDDSADETAATVSPRDALITIDDLPTGWTVAEVTGAPGENKVCEPRLEAPEPPREAEATFDRSQPSGALSHMITETTEDFAADYVADARRQASSCGTFTDEYQASGQTYRFTATSEMVNGPTFGDQTIWYVIHVNYQEPAPTNHDVVVCMDRHGGVISEIVLSTSPPPMTDSDRTMVEDLMRTASDRLEGGTGA